ncbi:MAG: squalene synthase HpnC [Chloroflexi bacterium]|nr:squalene synthase HpnC [Chloroflexota bacterium]
MIQSATSAVELPVPDMEVGSDSPDYLEASFAACEQLARSHYENFSVGSRLLPGHLRRHFFSIYAFSRGVDDLGDEGDGDRLALLDLWETELDSCYTPQGIARGPLHPYFVALHETIQQFDIPAEPFRRLIEANRRDQKVIRHNTFNDLLDYCTYSANPVGHLVLYLGGIRDLHLQRLADSTCTALQLTNFWQDVKRDHAIGRIYLPLSDMDQFDVSELQISQGVSDDRFRELMKLQVDRTRNIFLEGVPLIDNLGPLLRSDLALFIRGGLSVLQAIERQDYDVLNSRPTVSKLQKARIFLSTWVRSKLGFDLVPERAFKSLSKSAP